MLGQDWIALKQAHQALRVGHLEEAERLLGTPQVRGHRRSWELTQQLLRAYVERGEKHLRHDNSAAAWADLLRAEAMGLTDNAVLHLREALNRLGLAEVRAMLEAGDPARACEAITSLRQRGLQNAELEAMDGAARDWARAGELAEQGEFAQALQVVERLKRQLPTQVLALERFRADVERKSAAFNPALVRLHRAVQDGQWHEVLHLTEVMLASAPHHAEARRLRSRAWRAVEPSTIVATGRPRLVVPEEPVRKRRRYILWVDGIGGFLLCLDPEVTIGQATPERGIDVPVQADICRRTATITRDPEGYVLKAERTVHVNNQPAERTSLRAGDRVTLGTSCQMLFRQDVPISATARLDLVSGHRFGLAVDAVLLVAETLVLGPGPQAHVFLPDAQQFVLYQGKDGIGIRAPGNFSVNGHQVTARGVLGHAGLARGADFSLALEEVQ